MNQDANPNASNTPLSAQRPEPNMNGPANAPNGASAGASVSTSTATSPPTASNNGLMSTVKIAVPLLALVGVVFGVTYITMYTPPKEQDDENKSNTTNGPSSGEPPLVFFTSARQWDPPLLKGEYREFPLLAPSAIAPPQPGKPFSFTLQDRLFQGFYETDLQNYRKTAFWFENRNPHPVTMQLKGLSCSACTGGQLAAIPPEVTKNLLQHTAISVLPTGMFSGFGVGLVEPAAQLTKLDWTHYQFKDHRDAAFHIPAATNPDKWSPQWGILELTFGVGAGERKDPLRALFATKVDGTSQTGNNDFAIMFMVAPACFVSKASIDLGKLDLLSNDREYELFLYSATRGPGSEFGDLETPSCIVQMPSGAMDPVEFVKVSPPERIPEKDLTDVENQLQSRVRTAYKIKVTIHPKVGDQRMGIGLFERTLSLTAGSVTQQVQIRAMVSGVAWLENGRTDIDIGSYSGKNSHSASIDIITESPKTELVIVKDECKPTNFTYELEKQPIREGRGHYKLKITVPPGQFGKVKGQAVLDVKGSTPQRMLIPVLGSGRF